MAAGLLEDMASIAWNCSVLSALIFDAGYH